MATLHSERLARDFSDGTSLRRVLFPTTLTLHPGELTVLSGPSGSGKTTLLSLLGLVLQPTEGRLRLDDRDLTDLDEADAATVRRQAFGFVFQQPMLIEGLSVRENILLAIGIQGERPSAAHQAKAEALLADLGLAGTGPLQPRLLSGGMKQRVSIARALVKDPAVLLCDEPTSALDAESGQAVMRILKRVALEERRVVVVVSHDARVFPYADRLLKIENGQIVADARERYLP